MSKRCTYIFWGEVEWNKTNNFDTGNYGRQQSIYSVKNIREITPIPTRIFIHNFKNNDNILLKIALEIAAFVTVITVF